MTRMIRSFALVTTLGLALAASQAQAAFSGSMALAAIGPTTATGNLGDTTYSATSFFTTSTGTGNFSNVPGSTTFTGSSFTIGSSSGFVVSNGTYGTFTQTAAPVLESQSIVNGHVVSEDFYILGTYSGNGITAGTPTSFDISFTQNGGPGNSISASGTLVIPPAPVIGTPEPASVVMLGLGLAGFCGYGLRRRMAK